MECRPCWVVCLNGEKSVFPKLREEIKKVYSAAKYEFDERSQFVPISPFKCQVCTSLPPNMADMKLNPAC